MQNIKNKLVQLFLLLVFIIVISITNNYGLTAPEKYKFTKKEDALNVYVLDVGQGDSIFIQGPAGENILIDGGPDNTLIERLGQIMSSYKKTINYLILTHPHADHLTGLVELLKRYKIDRVYLTGVIHTSAEYLEFLNLLKEQGLTVYYIHGYKKIVFTDGVSLEFLAPLTDYHARKIDNLNNSSIINKITYQNRAILLSGDAEYEEERSVLAYYKNNLSILKADLYKVGHHGSKTASSFEFLNAMQAKQAIISCGLDNKFHHPHKSTLSKLKQKAIKVWRTDLQGTIHCWTLNNEDWKCESSQ